MAEQLGPKSPGMTVPVSFAGRSAVSETRSITEGEDGIRNLKATQAVEAAFLAQGFATPPGDVSAIITNKVRSAIKDLPTSQVANMTPGSGVLSAAATAAVEQFIGMLNPAQREAAKVGVNPLDPATMLKLNAALGQSPDARFGRMAARDGDGPASGARYDGMNASGLTQIQVQARDFALTHGLEWATHNPELLRLGPSAMQALADVRLREDSFKRFKDVGLNEKTIVNGARYAKRNHVDYNDASAKIEATDKELSPDGKAAHRKAIEGLFNCKPEEQETAKKSYNETMEGLKKDNTKAGKSIEEEQKALHTQKEKEHTAEKKADTNVAAKQATKSRLMKSLD
jgi:hypothetical protein